MREAELKALVDALAFGPTQLFPSRPMDADGLLDLYGGRLITRAELSALFAEKVAAERLVELRAKVFSGGRADISAASELRREMGRQIGLLSEEKQADLIRLVLGVEPGQPLKDGVLGDQGAVGVDAERCLASGRDSINFGAC